MAYCYPDFKSKAALKRAITSGEKVRVSENTPYGKQHIEDGHITLEGPHYPKAHTWYGICEVRKGVITEVI